MIKQREFMMIHGIEERGTFDQRDCAQARDQSQDRAQVPAMRAQRCCGGKKTAQSQQAGFVSAVSVCAIARASTVVCQAECI